MDTADKGPQLHVGHCTPPKFNGRADGIGRMSECKSDKFRWAAEEACLGASDGAPCNINAGNGINLTDGSCIRTSLGDLVCGKNEWRWIREDTCQESSTGQGCRFRARRN